MLLSTFPSASSSLQVTDLAASYAELGNTEQNVRGVSHKLLLPELMQILCVLAVAESMTSSHQANVVPARVHAEAHCRWWTSDGGQIEASEAVKGVWVSQGASYQSGFPGSCVSAAQCCSCTPQGIACTISQLPHLPVAEPFWGAGILWGMLESS